MGKKNSVSTVLITGASAGIGKALAEEYAAPGIRLFLSARNREALSETAENCRKSGAEVEISVVDVTDAAAVAGWVDSIAEQGPIDLAIANAGIIGSHDAGRRFESRDVALRQIDTNLGGCVHCVTSLVPHMQAQGYGHIALISSMSALQPLADMPAYAASKAGVNAYGEAIGSYLEADGIDVSVVCPGFVTTRMSHTYDFWRPFEMPVKAAAVRIRKALDRRRTFYAFPKVLYWSTCMGRLLPTPLRRLTTRPFSYRR